MISNELSSKMFWVSLVLCLLNCLFASVASVIPQFQPWTGSFIYGATMAGVGALANYVNLKQYKEKKEGK